MTSCNQSDTLLGNIAKLYLAARSLHGDAGLFYEVNKMETKKWWQSMTLWGALLAGVAMLMSGLFGVDVGPEEQTVFLEWLEKTFGVVGLLAVIVGRFRAKTVIG